MTNTIQFDFCHRPIGVHFHPETLYPVIANYIWDGFPCSCPGRKSNTFRLESRRASRFNVIGASTYNWYALGIRAKNLIGRDPLRQQSPQARWRIRTGALITSGID